MGSYSLEFKISVNWLRLIIIFALLSIIAYVLFPKWQGNLTFGVAVLGGVGVLISAINDIEVRQEEIKIRQEQIEQGKINAALRFVESWNHPVYFHLKLGGREVLKRFKAKGAPDTDFLNEKPENLANLIDLMNQFEQMSVAVQMNLADEPALRRFFRGILLEYWVHAETWVKARRAEKFNPRLYCEMEWLFNRWKS